MFSLRPVSREMSSFPTSRSSARSCRRRCFCLRNDKHPNYSSGNNTTRGIAVIFVEWEHISTGMINLLGREFSSNTSSFVIVWKQRNEWADELLCWQGVFIRRKGTDHNCWCQTCLINGGFLFQWVTRCLLSFRAALRLLSVPMILIDQIRRVASGVVRIHAWSCSRDLQPFVPCFWRFHSFISVMWFYNLFFSFLHRPLFLSVSFRAFPLISGVLLFAEEKRIGLTPNTTTTTRRRVFLKIAFVSLSPIDIHIINHRQLTSEAEKSNLKSFSRDRSFLALCWYPSRELAVSSSSKHRCPLTVAMLFLAVGHFASVGEKVLRGRFLPTVVLEPFDWLNIDALIVTPRTSSRQQFSFSHGFVGLMDSDKESSEYVDDSCFVQSQRRSSLKSGHQGTSRESWMRLPVETRRTRSIVVAAQMAIEMVRSLSEFTLLLR